MKKVNSQMLILDGSFIEKQTNEQTICTRRKVQHTSYIATGLQMLFYLTALMAFILIDSSCAYSQNLSLPGNGTKSSPYIIGSKQDMDTLADYVNGGGTTEGKYFSVLSTYSSKESISKVIGNSSSRIFKGNFDGNGIVLELNITASDYAGLFGCVGSGASISNVKTSGRVQGSNYCSGIVASFAGEKEVSISYCTNGASVSATGNYAGGVVGYASVGIIVSNCSNEGAVSGNDDIGGIIGYTKYTNKQDVIIKDCDNSGTVSGKKRVGGIVGNDYCGVKVIDRCNNSARITCNGSSAGGIAGEINIGSVIINCKNSGSIGSGDASVVGGIAGYAYDNVSILNCESSGYISVNEYAGGIVGRTYNNKAPVTISGCTNKGNITSNNYAGGIAADLYYSGSKISDCENKAWVTSTNAVGGIVGTMYEGTEVISCVSTSESKVTGNTGKAGGIVGSATKSLIDNCANLGVIGGDADNIGGIAGHISKNSEVRNSFNRNLVNSSATVGASGIGGIVGYCNALSSSDVCLVENCYNIGEIRRTSDVEAAGIVGNSKNSHITNCYNGGLLPGTGQNRPSIVHTNDGTINNSYYKKNEQYTSCTSGGSGTVNDCSLFHHTELDTVCSLENAIYNTTTMLSALNHWVANNSTGNKYKTWKEDETFENKGMPVFGHDEVILPIELVSFTAVCDHTAVVLIWTTATERNNDYFIVEHSADAINFTEIKRVGGAGNSIDAIDYTYIDLNVSPGDNYYRLVQVDYDGTRTTSEIIVANCVESATDEPDVQAYPNPFNGELTLQLDNFYNRPARIEVYDMLGKLIFTENVDAPQNSYQAVLNLSNLPPAAYKVRVSTVDFVINRNVVKQ